MSVYRLNFHLTETEQFLIERLAMETRRTKSNVARNLIFLGAQDPRIYTQLGALPKADIAPAEGNQAGEPA